jgi:hypothetical protein
MATGDALLCWGEIVQLGTMMQMVDGKIVATEKAVVGPTIVEWTPRAREEFAALDVSRKGRYRHHMEQASLALTSIMATEGENRRRDKRVKRVLVKLRANTQKLVDS